MPVLHIGDVEIVARTEQLTSPALHIKNAAGEIYHVAVMPLGGGVFDATETLVYEEDTINTCQTVTLPAGIYRVEMRGGTGGKPYKCSTGTGKTQVYSDIVSNVFKLDTETVVYSFRGGDGNNGAAIGNQAPGGGASGVDSMLIIGDRTLRASGGTGTRCLKFYVSSPGNGGWATSVGAGGGGGIHSDTSVNDGRQNNTSWTMRGCFAPGGGGSNASGGGAAGELIPVACDVSITSASPGTADGGGDGGNAENTRGDSIRSNTATGGAGGANVYYSCGGQVATSYGGGGGGGVCILKINSTCETKGNWCASDCYNGGDGGSGSTGTSNDSYIKIYKIG